MRPIPRSLLIHSAMLRLPAGVDVWQKPINSVSIDLSYIRIDPSSKVIISKDNTEMQLSSTLIYDCRNSRPLDITFAPEQIITWQDRDYKVITAEPLYDGIRLHHWELGLI